MLNVLFRLADLDSCVNTNRKPLSIVWESGFIFLFLFVSLILERQLEIRCDSSKVTCSNKLSGWDISSPEQLLSPGGQGGNIFSPFTWDKLDVNPAIVLRLEIPPLTVYCCEFRMVLISLTMEDQVLWLFLLWLVLLRDWHVLVTDVYPFSDEEGSPILFCGPFNFCRWRGRPEEEKEQARSIPNSWRYLCKVPAPFSLWSAPSHISGRKALRPLPSLGPDCVPLCYWGQLPAGKGWWGCWGASAKGDSTVCHLTLAGIPQCLGTDHQLCLGHVLPPASGTACAVHLWLDGVFTQYQWSYRLCHPGKHSAEVFPGESVHQPERQQICAVIAGLLLGFSDLCPGGGQNWWSLQFSWAAAVRNRLFAAGSLTCPVARIILPKASGLFSKDLHCISSARPCSEWGGECLSLASFLPCSPGRILGM